MPVELLLVSVPPYPHPHHGTAPRKPIADWGSLVMYERLPSLENIDTIKDWSLSWGAKFSLQCVITVSAVALKFWWTILSSQRSSHLSDCHFLPSADLSSVCSGISSGMCPGICNWLDWGVMLSRSISLIYGFLTYFILKADWLHYTLQQKELQWKKGSGNVFGDILRP